MISILAQTAADPLSSLLQYGVIGIFAVLLVIFSRALVKREQDRADSEHAENLRLNQLIQDKTIPALVEATKAIQSSQQILQQMNYQQEVRIAAERLNAKGGADTNG